MDSYMVYCEEGTFPSSQPLNYIPVVDVFQYSTKPLKWLRYITAAVVGCEGELVIYTEDENDPEIHTHLPLDLEDVAPSTSKVVFCSRRPYQFRRRCRLRSSDIFRSHYTKQSRVWR